MHIFNDKVVSLILGSPGSGKSTFIAKLVFEANKKDIPVYCNYPVKGTYMINVDDMYRYNLGKAVLIIDEAGLNYNSRNIKSLTLPIYHWLMTTRHRDTQIFFAVQSWKRVDIVLRELATEIILCSKFFFGFTLYSCYNSKTTLIENHEGYALEFQEVFQRVKTWLFHRPKYYHMFDTKHLDREYEEPPTELYPDEMFPVVIPLWHRLIARKPHARAQAQAGRGEQENT